MQTIKFWKWLSVLLLLCNIGLLVMLFLRPGPPHGHPPGGGPHKLDAFIIEELSLDKEQQKKFHSLKKEHREKINALLKAGRKLHNQYFSQLKKENGNDSLIESYANAIAKNQEEIEIATFNHFKSLREICTAVQKEAFDKIILEVLKRMAPPPPPPPPGPPNSMGGPPPPPPLPPPPPVE